MTTRLGAWIERFAIWWGDQRGYEIFNMLGCTGDQKLLRVYLYNGESYPAGTQNLELTNN